MNTRPDSHGMAPALVRGVHVLRLLEKGQPNLFTQIVAATNIPKASLVRLLHTLVELDLLRRDPLTKAFVARARLIHLEPRSRDLDYLVTDALKSLTHSTGHTSEWYVPSPHGLVLVRRCEPPEQEVAIRAKLGFTRPLDGELEAVAAVGNAWFRPSRPVAAGFWTYVRDGVKGTLTASRAQTRIRQALESGMAADECCNTNGVRRAAAVVRHGETPIGILAMAEFLVAPRRRMASACLRLLQDHARRLSEQSAPDAQEENLYENPSPRP